MTTDADARAREAREAFQWALSEAIPEDDLGVHQALEEAAETYAQAKADAEGQRQALAMLEAVSGELRVRIPVWYLSPESVAEFVQELSARVEAGEFGKVKHDDD